MCGKKLRAYACSEGMDLCITQAMSRVLNERLGPLRSLSRRFATSGDVPHGDALSYCGRFVQALDMGEGGRKT